MSTIGKRLKAVRQRAKMRQDQFASLLGCSRRTLINWEQDVVDPAISVLSKLRQEFDVDPEWVVLGTDDVPRSLFKSIDWDRLEGLESDVRSVCQDIGLDLTPEQSRGLVRAMFDDGQYAGSDNRKRLRDVLQALMKERGF